ncbi:hypothetical protein KRP22_011737 [Phytophthora ramorum]|uniref:Uncharacterized protein n=1 Tax=Phytophthora ramorum TaxID=164328 RepID=H3GKB5_PHYRM|nr:hypothetical protein KRP23_11201 [Phytophthora ramorum]KAH7498427.1 hypothetical protein KRP22_11571 [Phytophthora ramorum]KAH7499298.1 hypothetical protein KRP22_10787 [Phytophthora ramorum]
MKHPGSPSAALDAFDLDAEEATADEYKRRNCSSSNSKSKRQQRAKVVTSADTLRFAELKSQDPSVFAHLLADHFVAREAAGAGASPPARPQQLARPVAGATGLSSFRSWQFGERCLATYRVLFGRPLWTAATTPRPRKRKHVTPPTSSSSEGSDGGGGDALESTEELLALPTVDELLELPTDVAFELDDTEEVPDDVLASLAIGLDEGLDEDAAVGGDAIDLLWDFDASEVDGGVMLTEGEELGFLNTSPNSFHRGDAMEDI